MSVLYCVFCCFDFFTPSTASASEICSPSSDNNTAKRKVGREVRRWPERFWFICNLVLLLSSSLGGGVVGKKSFQDVLCHLVSDSSMCDCTFCSASGGFKGGEDGCLFPCTCSFLTEKHQIVLADFIIWWLNPPQGIQPPSVLLFAFFFFFCILCLICLPEEKKRKKKSPTCLSIVILDDVVITPAKWPSRKASRLLILPAGAWCCFHCSALFMLITPHSSVTRPGLCPAPCSCIFILLKCHRDCSDSNTHSDV